MEDFDDDDDFGDLYADVEVQASSAMNVVQGLSQLPSENDDNHDIAIENCEDGFPEEPSNAVDVNVDNATAEEEEEEEEESSESEDDFNIVLNDVKINTKINNVSSNNFNNELGFDIEANEEGNERHNNGTEQPSGGGAGGERGKGVVGGYNSQYKNMRFHTPAFPSNLKGSVSAGVASYSSPSVRSDREDSVYIHRTGSSSLAFQNRHKFSLPRSRTILDVNIDKFEQKPWRHPGADIADFFNFGFDEDSWKHYCNHLDKYREQTVKASRMFTIKSSRHDTECEVGYVNEEFANEAVAEKVAYSMQQDLKLISGRAIQVENCIFERQPSTDIWRPFDRDSDVIIQIAVQDFKEDCLTSAKEGVDRPDTFTHEASEIVTDGVDEARDILCSSSAIEDEQPLLEGHGDASGNSLPERSRKCMPASGPVSTNSDNNGSVQISDSDEHHEQEWTDLDGTAEAMEASEETGGSVERKISNTEPSVVEPESSNGGQSPQSPSSPSSRSRLERPRDGAYADLRESHQQSKVASPSSMSDLRESVTYDYHPSKDSKSYGVKTKPSDPKFHARRRSPMWDDLKYDRRRHTHMSEFKSHMDDEDVSYLSDAEGFHYTRHSTVHHQKQKNGQHGFDSYGGPYNSYYEGSEPLFDNGDLKPSNYNCRDAYTKSQNWKGHSSFGYEMDQRHRRNINEDQCHFEQKVSRVRHEEARQDLYHNERRRAVQDMESVTHEESRKWMSKYDSYLDKEEGTRWKTKAEDWQFTKRVKNDNFLLESHYKSDSMREQCREPVLYVDNDKRFHQHKYDKRLSYNGREIESPGRSRRRCDSSFHGVRNIWGADHEDEKGSLSFGSCKRPCSQSRQRWQGAVSPKSGMYRSHGRNWRNTGAERTNNNDRLRNFDNSFGANENIINLGDQDHFVRRHHGQSEVSHWSVDQYNATHWDNKVYAEGASSPFERASGPRRFDAPHGSDHVGRLVDCRQVSRGRFKLTRGRHRDSQCRRNSNFIHGETFPRCRDSVDSHLVGVDRKCILQSTAKSFEAGNMFYDRYEYMDCDSDLKQKTFEHSNQTYSENETRAENSKVDTKLKGQNRRDKFSDIQHNDSQDIEEGQIITEEVKEKTMEKMSLSEDMRQIGEKTNSLNENATNGNVVFEGHENPRILEIIAKMERRRERFKQPITVTKDAEETSQTPVDTVVETSDSKPQRPARKRKWDGS